MLLAWDDGLSVADMHDRSGLSPRRGRYWRRAFRQKRLGIFPAPALRAAAEGRPVPARPKDRRGVPPAPVKARPAAGVPASAAPTARERVLAAELLKRPGVEPDDPMAEAGRKTLRFHFQRVLQHEAGTRQGEDIEALHDMRVATRRMRAAFRVFEPYFDPDVVAPFLKGLRRAGQALGAVRDLDVFRDTVRAYQAALPPPQQGGLDPFLAELEMRREAARQEMIAYLDSGKFGRFVERFAVFAETPGMGSRPLAPDGNEPRPYRVRHVAPMAIYERLAEVRAYGEWIAGPDVPLARLHALRIDTKRLRYALEFFQEVLGTEARQVIRDTVAVQDHLGLIQDGVVASGILRDFLVWGTWGAQVEGRRTRSDAMPIMAPGVATYLAVRQSEVQQLVASFPQVWQRVTGPEFSRGLAEAVGVL
jgi:CHAD domain-containing protein